MATNSKIEWLDGDARLRGRRVVAGKGMDAPLRMRKARRLMPDPDIFAEGVPDAFIDKVFAVMALCPQHHFIALTKRAERMREYFADEWRNQRIYNAALGLRARLPPWWRMRRGNIFACGVTLPLPNVELCVSGENQQTINERVPHLLATPAAWRSVSYEPALGAVDFGSTLHPVAFNHVRGPSGGPPDYSVRPGLDQIYAGGESGPGARPSHPDWFRDCRDACAAAGVAFFFKQWGEWLPGTEFKAALDDPRRRDPWLAQRFYHWPDGHCAARIGKKRAGRLLDGVEHNALAAGLTVAQTPRLREK